VWIDNARVLAVFAVVVCHIAPGLAVASGQSLRSDGWIGNIYESLVRWCVPVFVMISGMLLLDPGKTEPVLVFYRKRASRILIPLLFWTAFFLVWISKGAILKGDHISLSDLAQRVVTGRPFYHMWFLYMVLGLYLFAPFLRMVIRQSSQGALVFLVAVLFAVCIVSFAFDGQRYSHDRFFMDRFPLYLPYFLAGYLIRTSRWQPDKLAVLAVFSASVIFTGAGSYLLAKAGWWDWASYLHGNLSVTVVPMSISMMFLLKELPLPLVKPSVSKRLGSSTLGIYLVHPLCIDVLGLLGVSATLYNPILFVPILTIVVFSVSLVIVQGICLLPYVRRIV
jgi:surface polysaccharide O-acyltransferase-like enzyme